VKTTPANDLAKRYVQQCIRTQARLGYRRPPRPVVDDVVGDVARTLERLLQLQERVRARV
jgi:hypothetical protein